MYRYEESGGIKLNKIGVERSMTAHLSLLVAQFFVLTNHNLGYPYLVQGRLFCTLYKKSFHGARLCKVVPLVPTVIQLRLLNSSYQKCRLGFLFCILFSALSVMMLL